MHSIIISQKRLTDDAVHRNVSIRYCKIKIIPPVSLLQIQGYLVRNSREQAFAENRLLFFCVCASQCMCARMHVQVCVCPRARGGIRIHAFARGCMYKFALPE